MAVVTPAPPRTARWAKVIDQSKCIGCHACTIACKAEHSVPLGVTRTYVKQVEVGTWPNVSRHFQVTRCNQCEKPPCVDICPVSAMYRRPDGIVDFDRDVCIGCKACIAACPYDAIYIDPASHSAEKCNFCAHRVDLGLEPACVVVCPERAIVVGDLDDPTSEVSRLVAAHKATPRKPEKATVPKVFYVEAGASTLVPGLAASPPLHAFAQKREAYPVSPDDADGAVDGAVEPQGEASSPVGPGLAGPDRHAGETPAGLPRYGRRSAAQAIVAYDVPHGPPWDWRVSAYTWTKSVASGAYLVAALLGLAGVPTGEGWGAAATVVSLGFLGLTGLLLVADLEHPERFWTILTRPQWKSWLARGAYLITLYGLWLGADLVARWSGRPWLGGLAVGGVVLSALTAVYTGFLFAQARARDLWQSPSLPAHLLAQAVVAGCAALLVQSLWLPLEGPALASLRWGLVGALGAHLLLALGEAFMTHPTEDAARAAHQLTSGAFRIPYWGGVAAAAGAVALAWTADALGGTGALAAASVVALVGLFLYEHAYVQAGQSVPLS